MHEGVPYGRPGTTKSRAYERPARMKGLIIGVVVLIALIILAILFFPDGVREPPRSGWEVGMPSMNAAAVRGKDGWCGTVLPPASPTHSDPTHVRVQLESGEQYLVPAAVRIQRWRCLRPAWSLCPCRVRRLKKSMRWCPCSRKSWRCRSGGSRRARSASPRSSTSEVQVDEPLWREEVEVTRVPMQRWWMAPCPCGRSMARRSSPSWKRCWLEKRWMLREEIHIRQQRSETHQPQRITLRSEEVQVERIPHTLMKIHERNVVWQRHW